MVEEKSGEEERSPHVPYGVRDNPNPDKHQHWTWSMWDDDMRDGSGWHDRQLKLDG